MHHRKVAVEMGCRGSLFCGVVLRFEVPAHVVTGDRMCIGLTFLIRKRSPPSSGLGYTMTSPVFSAMVLAVGRQLVQFGIFFYIFLEDRMTSGRALWT